MDVRVDHGGGCRVEFREQRVVAVEMAPGIDHHGVAVAHQHVGQCALADAVELQHVVQRGGGGEAADQIDGLPRGHAARHRVRLEAALAQEAGRPLARVAVAADHRDGRRPFEAERREARQAVHLGRRERAEVERRAESDSSLRHALRAADVEHLHVLAAVEPLREVGRGHLRQFGVRHGISVTGRVQKRNGGRGSQVSRFSNVGVYCERVHKVIQP